MRIFSVTQSMILHEFVILCRIIWCVWEVINTGVRWPYIMVAVSNQRMGMVKGEEGKSYIPTFQLGACSISMGSCSAAKLSVKYILESCCKDSGLALLRGWFLGYDSSSTSPAHVQGTFHYLSLSLHNWSSPISRHWFMEVWAEGGIG